VIDRYIRDQIIVSQENDRLGGLGKSVAASDEKKVEEENINEFIKEKTMNMNEFVNRRTMSRVSSSGRMSYFKPPSERIQSARLSGMNYVSDRETSVRTLPR